MTLKEKLDRAVEVRDQRLEELSKAAKEHAAGGSVVPLGHAAKAYTNAEHARGRAFRAWAKWGDA